MHFWIDKRSQCYTGRHRVPSSLSTVCYTGVGRGRGRVCVGGGRKGMAAPVHRYPTVECPPRPRPPRSQRQQRQAVPVHAARRGGGGGGEGGRCAAAPPQPTIASLAAARRVTPDTLLRTAALGLAHHHSPMMAPQLKLGVLVSLAVATVFLAGAKYYYDRQVGVKTGAGTTNSGEASAVCAAVAGVCGVGCALARCRARPPPPVPPERVSSTALRPPPRQAPPDPPSDDISLSTVVASGGSVTSPEAPPPYHIAVLLPPRRDSSPPAYSALS